MRVLALDMSTKTGWAVAEGQGGSVSLEEYGLLTLSKAVIAHGDNGYPDSYWHAARAMADQVLRLVDEHDLDVVVIEETNLGKSRYAQKILEFIHCLVVGELSHDIVYLDSSGWRKALGLRLSKDQRKDNARLSKAKRDVKVTGGKLDKTALGIKGKVTQKHLAVEYANNRFGLSLKMKDNDIADAICMACAYCDDPDIVPCDGT